MPSEYPSKQEMASRSYTGPARPSETDAPAPTRAGKRTAMSGLVQKLARSLGRDPEELAAQIDPDTIRRTKFPVLELRDEDGKTTFKQDPGIIEGPRPSVRR